MNTEELQARLRQFAQEREWDQYHNPKNLVMALTGEVGELVELFQWLTPQQATDMAYNDARQQDLRDELADVFGYLLRLADVLDVDLEQALTEKIDSNAVKYPIEKSRGSAAKYTEFLDD